MMQVRDFKLTFRGVIDRGIYDEHTKQLFSPIKTTGEKFLSLGIKGKHQAPGIAIIIDDEVRACLEDKLIMLGHKISGNKLKDFKAGVHTLRAMPLALRGRVGWDSTLGKIINIITNKIVLPSAMIPVMTILATLCNMFQGPYAWPVPNARQLNSVPTKPSSSMIWTKLLSASHAIQIKRLVNGRAHAIPRGIFARLIN